MNYRNVILNRVVKRNENPSRHNNEIIGFIKSSTSHRFTLKAHHLFIVSTGVFSSIAQGYLFYVIQRDGPSIEQKPRNAVHGVLIKRDLFNAVIEH